MNSPMPMITRRGFALLAAPLLGLLRARPARAARLEWASQPPASRATRRSYRADAQVLLLSVPFLHRTGVGGGSAVWSEDSGVRLLEFTGYSLPERAAGLNRLGYIREMAYLDSASADSIYFGLMTASPEESAEEARRALVQHTRELVYSAIDGRVAPGEVVTASAHFTAPAQLSGAPQEELIRMAQHALAAAPEKPPEFDPHSVNERTFLQALAELLAARSPAETRYVYNGRLYRLWLRASPDPKSTRLFRDRHLIAGGANVIHASGKLRRESGGKESNFQLWVEEGAARPLPLRIEYQAKSYLRLVFEAV